MRGQKSKRIESKITKFPESKTHDEFRRKMIEFDYYKVRCNIAAEEVSDDLYRFCETHLKKKLISSSKIVPDIKFTDPEIMKMEIKRLCSPR